MSPAHGLASGHDITWDSRDGVWRFDDTGDAVPLETVRSCRHCNQRPVPVAVIVPADLSFTGEDRVAVVPVDACLADLVRRLNAGATSPITRASCCGHGTGQPEIMMADGTRLLVVRS